VASKKPPEAFQPGGDQQLYPSPFNDLSTTASPDVKTNQPPKNQPKHPLKKPHLKHLKKHIPFHQKFLSRNKNTR
jgi:hypothetical protein